jgi:hypothetical protein
MAARLHDDVDGGAIGPGRSVERSIGQDRDGPRGGRSEAALPVLATADPASRSRTALALQRRAGNAAVQRALQRHIAQRSAVAPGSARPRLRQDALYEQMAHNMAYLDGPLSAEDQVLLRSAGYDAGSPLLRGSEGLQMRTFVPLVGPLPEGVTRPRPVVAFRGTQAELSMEGLADLMADLDAGGIGLEQFLNNAGRIEGAMRRAAHLGSGQVVVCGHSLGGALAQIAAAIYPELVAEVVTFQAPGINRDLVRRLEGYNRRARERGETGVGSTHYRADGDIVDMAGQGFTPGRVHNIDPDQGPLGAHQAMIVSGLARQQPGGAPELAGMAATGAMTDRGSHSTDENNTEFRATDAARRVAGTWGGITRRGGGLIGGVLHLRAQMQMAEMQRVWIGAQVALQTGGYSAAVAVVDASDLDASARRRVLGQLRHAALARVGAP